MIWAILPTSILNQLGWFVSFIWLLFLGEWRMLAAGVIATFAVPIITSLPVGTLALLVQRSTEIKKSKILLQLISTIAGLFSYSGFILIPAIIYYIVLKHYYSIEEPASILPYALLAYAVATSPFNEMAQKEIEIDKDSHAPFTAVVIQWGCLIHLLGALASTRALELETFAFIQGFVVVSGFIFQIKYTHKVRALNYEYLKRKVTKAA